MEFYLKAIKMSEEYNNTDNIPIAICYNSIAGLYTVQGNYSKALEYFSNSLTVTMKIFGENHSSIAKLNSNIGWLYSKQNEYSKALDYSFNAVKIYEKISDDNNPEIAQTYNNIGDVYYAQGKYLQALDYYLKEWNIVEEIFGYNHYRTIQAYRVTIAALSKIIESSDGESNTKQFEKYHSQLQDFLSKGIFTLTVSDSTTLQNGMSGKYTVLYYEGWEYGKNEDLTAYNKTLSAKPKRLVLMKDAEIKEYLSDASENQYIIDIEPIAPNNKVRILNDYKSWKKNNKNK